MNKYLIFRTDRLGDFLVTAILIRSIKRNDPSSYIIVVASRNNYDYIKNHSCNIFLLENIRFYKEEVLGDCGLAEDLSSLADVYINDAFSASHRKHSSVFTICDFFQKKSIGPLFAKEIQEISHFIKNPTSPTSFIFGGSKLSTKIKTINNVIKYADNIIIGGAMAFPFLKQN